METPRVRYATTTDGVSIAYATIGAGPPLVSIMPFPWTHIDAASGLPELRRWIDAMGRGRQLIVYDSRGMGLSGRPAEPVTLDALLRDLDAVVGHLGLERFALQSAPTAGPIAIAYTAREPERVAQLVLWCTFARGADGYPRQLDALYALGERDWELYTETVAHALIGWNEGEFAHRFAQFLRQCATPELAKAFHEMLRAVDVTPLLASVRASTLVLVRRGLPDSWVAASRALAAGIPDARLALLEGTSPAPFIGDMDAVVTALHEFLDGGVRHGGDASPSPVVVASTPLAILVTDVEGSTALAERTGDASARAALRRHDEIVREAFRAHGGTEVKAMGDGFIASFPAPSAAVACAIAIQRAITETSSDVRVRIGINAGEPIVEAGDLYGTAVNVAARVATLAAGGEIVVTDVVRQLVAGKGFAFVDRGEASLRGISAPVRVAELRWRAD